MELKLLRLRVEYVLILAYLPLVKQTRMLLWDLKQEFVVKKRFMKMMNIHKFTLALTLRLKKTMLTLTIFVKHSMKRLNKWILKKKEKRLLSALLMDAYL